MNNLMVLSDDKSRQSWYSFIQNTDLKPNQKTVTFIVNFHGESNLAHPVPQPVELVHNM